MAQAAHTETPRRAPPGKMTYEEFLAWCDEDTWAEWVDGEVIILSPASKRHQELARFLLMVLGFFVEAHDLGIVLPAPFQMKLGPSGPGREPDLLFVAREHLDRLHPTFLEGPADLVVEITSPESISRDRGEKYVEYEAAGIPEYWLIDPDRRQAEFYRLGSDGHYRVVLPDAGGLYRAVVLPGFWLRVDWLWQEPLPPVLAVLAELGILPRSRR
jgi:Uma2 family endonuclease